MLRRADNAADRVAALVQIWRDVLDKPTLGEESDIFENGGTSLHVLQIAGRIYDDLELDVQLRDVFTHASPRSLVNCLSVEEGVRRAEAE